MNKRVNYSPASAQGKNKPDNKKPMAKKSSSKKLSAKKHSKQGAQSSELKHSSLLQSWLSHHRSSCTDSLKKLLETPLQSLLTWLVVAIALVLPAALYLALNNAQQFGQGWQDNAQMSVFVKQGAKPAAIEQLQLRLEGFPEVDAITLITPEEAWSEFQRYSGLGLDQSDSEGSADLFDSLGDNPLPAVIILNPKSDMDKPEQLALLQNKIAQQALVDSVQLDLGWLRRLNEMMNLAQRVVLVLAGLLALGVLLIIGNTIRLAIESRREEIVVVKMVGGTDEFVRRPFLYTGLWYGIGGGIIAFLLLVFIGLWLSSPIQELIALYESDYSLTWLSFGISFILIAGAGALGWLGALLAVSRHLRNIEPV